MSFFFITNVITVLHVDMGIVLLYNIYNTPLAIAERVRCRRAYLLLQSVFAIAGIGAVLKRVCYCRYRYCYK